MQIPGNNYQPAQTFCWTGTGIFRENRGQADIVKPCNQASKKYQASRPATFSFSLPRNNKTALKVEFI